MTLVGLAPASAGTLTAPSFTAMDPRTGITGNRYDWAFTTATNATLSRVTMSTPAGTTAPNRYLALNSAMANYASAPSSSANTLTGDFDIRAKLALTNLTSDNYIIGKFGGGTNSAWALGVNSSGYMFVEYSTAAHVDSYMSSNVSLNTFPLNTPLWVRGTFKADNGASGRTATFYTSADGSTWAALGTPNTQSGVVTLAAATANVDVGGVEDGNYDNFSGKLYYADVRNAISAQNSPSGCSSSTTVVSCFDPNQAPATITPASPTWTSTATATPSEVWTMHRAGSWPLKADIAADLSVATVSGLPTTGAAVLRQMDGTASYAPTSSAAVTSGTSLSIGLMGFTNTTTANSYTSTITTWDNSTTPVAIDTAPTAGLSFTNPTITTANLAPPTLPSSIAATTLNMVPNGLTIDGTTVYVSDTWANTVVAVDSSTGLATRYAGTGFAGYSGNSGPATSGTFNGPTNMAVDSSGNLYVDDAFNGPIREVTKSTGNISNFAGCNCSGFGGDGGLATSASLSNANNIVIAANGDAYISDRGNNRIRKVDHTNNFISTIAGDGTCGSSGDTGSATAAELCGPQGIALDASGNIYFADKTNNKIREITTGGIISTVAGTGTPSFSGDGSLATSATLSSPVGIAFNSAGDLYIADQGNNRIRKIDHTTLRISTVAGTGTVGNTGDGGLATAATMSSPTYLKVDSSGNIYVVDSSNFRVRKFTDAGNISNFAGNGVGSLSGDGGTHSGATYFKPSGLTSDLAGNLYVADQSNNAVRKINQWGQVSTIAGLGRNNSGSSGDSGRATAARLNTPRAVAVASTGVIYIADSGNNKVRAIASNGTISTLATLSGSPQGIAVNPVTGDIWTISYTSCLIEKITPGGTKTTVAGTNGTCAVSGDNGSAASATVKPSGNGVDGLAFDAAGDLFFVDNNSLIREINLAGTISTVAGGGGSTADNMAPTAAQISNGSGLYIDPAGAIFEVEGTRVRKFTPGGLIVTVAGTGAGNSYSGDGGAATSATFGAGNGIAAVNGQLYFSDLNAMVVRKVADIAPLAPQVNPDTIATATNTPATWPIESNDWDQDGEMDPNSVAIKTAPAHGTVTISSIPGIIPTVTFTPTTNYAGSDSFTYQACDSTLIQCGTATVTVTMGSNQVTTVAGGIAEGSASNINFIPSRSYRFRNFVFMSDQTFNVVRRYDIYSKQIYDFAGNGALGNSGDGGPATLAAMNTPRGIAVMPDGTVEVADSANNTIRQIATNGVITTVAGTGVSGNSNDGSAATTAALSTPTPLVFGSDGALYVGSANKIRKFAVGGTISTYAGTGTTGSSGDNGLATSALLNTPYGLALNSAGDLYIADASAHVIRKVTMSTGLITTVAGTNNTSGFSGDGLAATSATFNTPKGISIDSTGAILVADNANSRIRKFTDGGTISTVAGSASSGGSGDSGAATSARINGPNDVPIGPGGTDYYITDSGNARVRYVSTASIILPVTSTAGGGTFSPDGSLATLTQLSPASADDPVGFDASSNILIGEAASATVGGYRIRSTAPTASGTISTLASGINPGGLALDPNHLVVYVDGNTCKIYRINANQSITTLAGNGTCAYTGDNGQATLASLSNPMGITYDSAGNLYEAERTSAVVRKITPGGIITTVAGTGTTGYNGDGALGTATQLSSPRSLATDTSGNILITDFGNQRIRELDKFGYVTTIAGNGVGGFSGDGGAATAAQFQAPRSVTVDNAGNIFVSDSNNQRVRKIDPTGIITTAAGSGTAGFVDNTAFSSAQFSTTAGIVADGAGNVYVAEVNNHRVRKLTGVGSATINPLGATTWSVLPGNTGHPNLANHFVITPAATSVSSKMTIALPTGVSGTPVVTASYGLSGTVTASLVGTTLTLNYPSQTITPSAPIGLSVEGFAANGAAGAHIAYVAEYDSTGTTAIGWSRSSVTNFSGTTGAPAAGTAGYGTVWARSLTTAASKSAMTITVSPVSTAAADTTSNVTSSLGGNLNANSLSIKAAAPSGSRGTLASVTTDNTTGVATGAFTVDRWGYALTTSTGTASGVLGSTNFAGHTSSLQGVATGLGAANSIVVSERMRVDYLIPAGQYMTSIFLDYTPGS